MTVWPGQTPPGGEPRPGRKTSHGHWNSQYEAAPALRLSSRFSVGTTNLRRLLAPYLRRPGTSFVELGCAPGRILGWAAASCGARVTGLDYSEAGVATTRALLQQHGLPGDVRCEDVFAHSLPIGTFDVAYSCGLIEHFDDPREIVAAHAALLGPGGVALIVVPNYGGIFGRIQRWFDPENLALHNLEIMSLQALAALAPSGAGLTADAFRFGRLSPGLVSWRRRLPGVAATLVYHGVNVLGLLQPRDVGVVAPHLVLRVRRAH